MGASPKTPRIGPGHFRNPVVRQRYYVDIVRQSNRWLQRIKEINRRPIANISLTARRYEEIRFQVKNVLADLDELEGRGLPIPTGLRSRVYRIDDWLKNRIKQLSPEE